MVFPVGWLVGWWWVARSWKTLQGPNEVGSTKYFVRIPGSGPSDVMGLR